MLTRTPMNLVCATLVGMVLMIGPAQAGQGSQAAAAAAKASPALVAALSKDLGSTPEQAAGAAGALFALAQSRLKPAEFSQVSKAVPGMDVLLKAAPSAGGGAGALGGLGQFASAAGVPAVTSAFSRLGLKPELVPIAASTLVSFVTKSGGPDVGSLLAGALK